MIYIYSWSSLHMYMLMLCNIHMYVMYSNRYASLSIKLSNYNQYLSNRGLNCTILIRHIFSFFYFLPPIKIVWPHRFQKEIIVKKLL